MTKQILLTLFLIFAGFSAVIAQNSDKTISGIIKDENGETMEQVTVQLLQKKDSTFVSGVVSLKNGSFKLQNVKPGNYLIRFSFVGYAHLYKPATITAQTTNLTIGEIKMNPEEFMLKEAVVTGKVPEVVVKLDTIEYNADSYKTPPNSVVEDLLKRLPGVEVDKDGNVKANGKEVKKIYVDGKEFFGNDPKMATKNLPTNMIDKLQVIDSKSDMAKLTGIDDGDDETVINLTVKKGMKEGWFGNAQAGAGTKERYQANLNANRFVDESQFSLIAKSNNNNNMGSSDAGAGMYSRQRGGGSAGINTSHMAGVNFNSGKDEKFRIGGDIRISSSKQDNETSSHRQNILQDSVSYNNSAQTSFTRSNDIVANLRMTWEIDTLTTLDFRPNISYNNSFSSDYGNTSTLSGNLDSINSSTSRSESDAHGYNLSGRLIVTRKSALKKGRQYSLGVNYSNGRSVDDGINESNNYFYLNDSTSTINQKVNETTWRSGYQVDASYIEPIFTNRFLTFSYRFNYNSNNADKLAYDLNLENNPLDSAYSNRFRNEFISQRFNIGFRTIRPKYNYTIGFDVDPSRTKSINLIDSTRNVPARTVINYAPSVRFVYLFSKRKSLNIFYRGRTSQPSVSQLQPVQNISDPLRIQTGNPDLLPAFSNNIMGNYQNYNADKQRSIRVFFGGSYNMNSIVNKTTYNSETGVQTTMPVNVNGVWNTNASFFLSAPFKNKKYTYSTNTNVGYRNNVGFNNGIRNNSGNLTASEQASLNYRCDLFDIGLRGNITYQNTVNSVQKNSNREIINYGGNLNGSVYLPGNITLSTDMDYTGNAGYSDGYNQSQWLWNAQAAVQFLKKKQATITFKIYDILQQRSNVTRVVTGNYIQDTQYNTLTSYCMLTFIYSFKTFGGKAPGSSDPQRERGGRRMSMPMGHPGNMRPF